MHSGKDKPAAGGRWLIGPLLGFALLTGCAAKPPLQQLDAAEYLVERQVKTVGIDYLSIERFGSTTFEVHKTLLGREIPIIEGLDLSAVGP